MGPFLTTKRAKQALPSGIVVSSTSFGNNRLVARLFPPRKKSHSELLDLKKFVRASVDFVDISSPPFVGFLRSCQSPFQPNRLLPCNPLHHGPRSAVVSLPSEGGHCSPKYL